MSHPISHKYTKFADLPGESSEEKIQLFINSSTSKSIIVQEKLNGVSARYQGGRLFTKDNKEWKRHHFPADFWNELESIELPSHYCLLGELISPTLSFQDLGAAVAVNRKEMGNSESVVLKAFDIYNTTLPPADQPHEVRNGWLSKWLAGCTDGKLQRIGWLIETQQADVIKFYNYVVDNGGEGIVMIADPYIIGDPTIRIHPDIVKWKKLHEMEGTCVDLFEGKGKRRGMLGSFLLRLDNNKYVLVGGGKGIDDTTLTKWWIDRPIGKNITITYEDMSTSGVPLRPQIKGIRDYE